MSAIATRVAREPWAARADSQLGIKDNCEVLDHLKMCPECSKVVDEHQAVRAAVGRSIVEVGVPGELRGRIEGREVFLCCSGCEERLRGDPKKYLAKLDAQQR